MTTARRQLDLAMTEAQWQHTVVDLARTLDWQWYHTHDSRRSQPGFPDLVLVRDRVIFAELKTVGGRLDQWQKRWGNQLVEAGAEWYCWRPHHYAEVERTLTRQGREP
jgi:VRR-NUC domain